MAVMSSCLQIELRRLSTVSALAGSRLATGSSARIIVGCCASARDTDTLFLPGELIDPAERLIGESDVKGEPSGQDIVERAVALDELMVLEDDCGTAPVLAQQLPWAQDSEFPRDDLSVCRRHQMIDRP